MTIASLKSILLSLADSEESSTTSFSDSIAQLSPDDFYLDLGLIDSFSINSFILLVESEFNVTLTAHDLQSFEFRTLSGLMSIIQSKLNGS